MTQHYIEIEPSQCKGCKLCVESCPCQCIVIGSKINEYGYQYARFDKQDCTACGICYYVCPELGAITVFKADKKE